MKVICVDNYARETRSDRLVAENLTEGAATALAEEKNDNCADEDYFRVVPDDYKLHEWEP